VIVFRVCFPVLYIPLHLPGDHVTELLSFVLLSSEIGYHAQQVLFVVVDPFLVVVCTRHGTEGFLKQFPRQFFIRIPVVFPESQFQPFVIVQFHQTNDFNGDTYI